MEFNISSGERTIGRENKAGNTRFYYADMADMLGSTRVVVNENNAIEESVDYDPMGLRLQGRTTGSDTTRIGFTGKERDAVSQLDYFGARFYKPAIGRWGSPDPLADEFPGWSSYNYALGNPVSLVDLDGRCAQSIGDTITVTVEVQCPNGSTDFETIEAVQITDPQEIEAFISTLLTAEHSGDPITTTMFTAGSDMMLNFALDLTNGGPPYDGSSGLFEAPNVTQAGNPVLTTGGVPVGTTEVVIFRRALWDAIRNQQNNAYGYFKRPLADPSTGYVRVVSFSTKPATLRRTGLAPQLEGSTVLIHTGKRKEYDAKEPIGSRGGGARMRTWHGWYE